MSAWSYVVPHGQFSTRGACLLTFMTGLRVGAIYISRMTTAIAAAALSLLPLGQPLLLGSTTALATAAVVLSTQAADAQSAAFFINRGRAKFKNGDYQGAITDYTMAIEINPQYANAYVNRGIDRELANDLEGACDDWRKAVDLGKERPAEWVKKQC